MAPSSLFPRDDAEFYARFQDELACLRFLEAIRWPDGFVCPGCGCRDAWLMGTGHRRCVSCRRRTSVTAGTIFAGSRTPLAVWFRAAWKMTSSKGGISAFELHRMLGVSVQTAWTMLHKYRRAMIRPHRELLSERVQVDEAYVGAPEKGTRGRGVTQKAIVAIAVEVRGKGCGRVRMQRVASLTSENLLGFIEETVAPGWVDDRDGNDETLHATIVETDALSIYRPLARTAYEHVVINQAASDDPAHVTMPQVHRVASLLKRWLLGTHQGGVQQRHLDAYLDEFVFRFNRRASRDRGKLFYRLLELAAVHDQTTYRQLVGGRNPRPA